MSLVFEPCQLGELKILQEISIETFTDTFKEQNTERALIDYLEEAYNENQLKKELLNPSSFFYFLKKGSEIVGYLKLNIEEAQSEDILPTALEVQRIYIRKPYKRNGYGREAIKFSENLALQLQKKQIWLGVWEYNTKALAFYKTQGFKKIGDHPFFMGEEKQIDLILSKNLT